MIRVRARLAIVLASWLALASLGYATGHVVPQAQGSHREILLTSERFGWLAVGLAGWHPYVTSGEPSSYRVDYPPDDPTSGDAGELDAGTVTDPAGPCFCEPAGS